MELIQPVVLDIRLKVTTVNVTCILWSLVRTVAKLRPRFMALFKWQNDVTWRRWRWGASKKKSENIKETWLKFWHLSLGLHSNIYHHKGTNRNFVTSTRGLDPLGFTGNDLLVIQLKKKNPSLSWTLIPILGSWGGLSQFAMDESPVLCRALEGGGGGFINLTKGTLVVLWMYLITPLLLPSIFCPPWGLNQKPSLSNPPTDWARTPVQLQHQLKTVKPYFHKIKVYFSL